MIKKIVAVSGVICVVGFALLCTNYVSNERFIKAYNGGIYENSEITPVLGFTQPYVYHYNQGDVYYGKGDYEGAEQEFRKALESGTGGDRDCSIRINLALSIAKQIDPEKVTKENLDETIDRLEDAKSVLTENGCAHKDDEDGHNEDAQKLKDEIDDFEEELKKQVDEQQEQEDQDKKDDKEKSGDESESTEEEVTEEDAVKQQLQDIQNDSLNQRKQEMDEYGAYQDGYSYYDGQTW